MSDPQMTEIYDLIRILEWKVEDIVALEFQGWEPVSKECGEVTMRKRHD